jgi:poly [ADP-ribose] polymerase 2/3/4
VAQKLIQSTILSDESGRPLNSLDAHFLSLGLSSMEPIKRSAKEFTVLEKYAKDTHGATHYHYKVNIDHVFRVERSVIFFSCHDQVFMDIREFETKAWEKAGFNSLPDGERLLLWHGSRTTNFVGK